MDLKTYQELKLRQHQPPRYRAVCLRCRKAEVTCYCRTIRPFNSTPEFVILMHPHEVKRTVATGRMTHLCLSNSRLFEGLDFTEHEQVNKLIADENYYSVLLFPDKESINLSVMKESEKHDLVSSGKKLLIFLLDGTWDQARSIKFRSKNLQLLPRICFTPPGASRFQVRKQPASHCYSTIESVHHLIGLMGQGLHMESSTLLETFAFMVRQQINYAEVNQAIHGVRATRGIR